MPEPNNQFVIADERGREINARFACDRYGDKFHIDVASWSHKHNADQAEGLRLVLARLAAQDFNLVDARLNSRPKVQQLSDDERRLPNEYPVRLAKVTDLGAFADRLRSSAGKIVQAQSGAGGYNGGHRLLLITQPKKAMLSASELADILVGSGKPVANQQAFGQPYRAPSSSMTPRKSILEIDIEKLEDSLEGHRSTQNKLAAFLREVGCNPLTPGPNDPEFDVGWCKNGIHFVAEVKSTTQLNEERQLRLGLGQVLRYRQAATRSGRSVRAILVAERPVKDRKWVELCSSLDVVLTWPDFAELKNLGSPKRASRN